MVVIRRSNDRKKLKISALIFGHENAKKTKTKGKAKMVEELVKFHFCPIFTSLSRKFTRGNRIEIKFPGEWGKNGVEINFYQLFIFVSNSFTFSARDFFPFAVSSSISFPLFSGHPGIIHHTTRPQISQKQSIYSLEVIADEVLGVQCWPLSKIHWAYKCIANF